MHSVHCVFLVITLTDGGPDLGIDTEYYKFGKDCVSLIFAGFFLRLASDAKI